MLLPYTPLSKTLDIAPFTGAWDMLRDHFGIRCQTRDFDKGDLPVAAVAAGGTERI